MNDRIPCPDHDALAQIRGYHERTKHHFGRYAASPGYMDWATQPDPFRRFAGCQQHPLPLVAGRLPVRYADLFQPSTWAAMPLNRQSVAALLELSFGLSAWKHYGGDRWALRCNPSSGNLHPIEAYAVCLGIEGLPDGVYHYVSHDHALESRCQFQSGWRGLLVGLSSIHWREAWKYGERAFRYCQHDIGHALGALRYAAAVLGWRVRLWDAAGDDDIASLLGLNRLGDFADAEAETPDLLCWLETPASENLVVNLDSLLQTVLAGHWQGQANSLSRQHLFDWPVIDEAAAATRKPRTAVTTDETAEWPDCPPDLLPTACELAAAHLIKQRRSAQAFDGVTAIPAKALYRLLDAVLPRRNLPPFDAWPWPPRVHLVLFVHRVLGLPPGVYLCCRRAGVEAALREAMTPGFLWDAIADCPRHIPLFRLVRADAREAAAVLSCQQAIAGDSAFSLGMLAEFDAGLSVGAWGYRRLFWECGLIGQTLYLEAEAAGVRGTGIGCYFDDPVHELLGLQDAKFQSLYHFTIGGALADARLQSLPGYAHLDRQADQSL